MLPSPTPAPLSRRRFLLTGLAVVGGLLAPLRASAVRLHGIDYHTLDEVAGWLGMKKTWVEAGKTLRISSQWTTMDFTLHQRSMRLNGVQVHLGWPIAGSNGRLHLSQTDYERTLQPLLTPHIFTQVPRLGTIVIDPGHGAHDPGAQNNALKLTEKHLALDVSQRLAKLLRARGYKVILTREDDRFLELTARSAAANSAGADLFLSVHFNASTASSVAGAETFVFTPQNQPSTSRNTLAASDKRAYPANANDVWNVLAGFYIQKELVTDLKPTDRGLKRARFTVLRDLKMPGVLIEGGFVTHPTEGRNIGSAGYRQQIAQSIAEGVYAYQRTLNRLRS